MQSRVSRNRLVLASQAVFAIDSFLCRLFFLRRKNARSSGEFRTGDFASRTARSNFDGRIVADALIFSGVIAGLNVQFSVALSKPYGCVNWHAALSEGC